MSKTPLNIILFSAILFFNQARPVQLHLVFVTSPGLVGEITKYAAGQGGMLGGLGMKVSAPSWLNREKPTLASVKTNAENQAKDAQHNNFLMHTLGLKTLAPPPSRCFSRDLEKSPEPGAIRLVLSDPENPLTLKLPHDWIFFRGKANTGKDHSTPFCMRDVQTGLSALTQLSYRLTATTAALRALLEQDHGPLSLSTGDGMLSKASDMSKPTFEVITTLSTQVPAIFLNPAAVDLVENRGISLLTILACLGCSARTLQAPQAERASLAAHDLLELFTANIDTIWPLCNFGRRENPEAATRASQLRDKFLAEKGAPSSLEEFRAMLAAKGEEFINMLWQNSGAITFGK